LFPPEFQERFWSHVEKTHDCWLWCGPLRDGRHGSIKWKGRMLTAHKVAWEISGGALAPGQQVWHRCGHPDCVRPDHLEARTMPTAAERFWSKVQTAGPSDCWLWVSPRKTPYGYGLLSMGRGKNIVAHRFSWELHNGPIPDGRWVLHHCDNPPCVNPAHLFLGDNRANYLDSVAKGRDGSGSRQPHARLNAAVVKSIRERYSHPTYAQLAAELGVSVRAIRNAVVGDSWKHVI
jgi:hypothetical protein